MTSDDKFIIGFGVFVTAAVVGVLWFAIWLANEDAKAWAEFTATHVCERTERTAPGYYITSYVNKVLVMTWVPGQVAWDCDDGKSYWRDE